MKKEKLLDLVKNEMKKRKIDVSQNVDDNYRTQFDGQLWGKDFQDPETGLYGDPPSGDSGVITNPPPMGMFSTRTAQKLLERIWTFGELCKFAVEDDEEEDVNIIDVETVEEDLEVDEEGVVEPKPFSPKKIVEYIPAPQPAKAISSEETEDFTYVKKPQVKEVIEEPVVEEEKTEEEPVVEEEKTEEEPVVEEEKTEEELKKELKDQELQEQLASFLEDLDDEDSDDSEIDDDNPLNSMTFDDSIPEYISEEEIEKRRVYMEKVHGIHGRSYAGYSELMKSEFGLIPVDQPTLGDKREELSDLPDEETDHYFNKKTLGSREAIDELFSLGTTWRELGRRLKENPDFISYRILPMLTLIVGKSVIKKIVNSRYFSKDHSSIFIRGVKIPVGTIWIYGPGIKIQRPAPEVIIFAQKEIPKILKVYLENGSSSPPKAPIMGYLTKALVNNLSNHLVRDTGNTVLKTRPTCSFCNLNRGKITTDMKYEGGSGKKPLEPVSRGKYFCPRCYQYIRHMENKMDEFKKEMDETKYIIEQARASNMLEVAEDREVVLAGQEHKMKALADRHWAAKIFARPSRQHIVCPEDSCSGRQKTINNEYMPSRIPISCVHWDHPYFSAIDTETKMQVEKKLLTFGVQPPVQTADDAQVDVPKDRINYKNVFMAPEILSEVPFKCPFCFNVFTPNSAKNKANGWGGLFIRPRVIKWNEPEPFTFLDEWENLQPSAEKGNEENDKKTHFIIPQHFIELLLFELTRQSNSVNTRLISMSQKKLPPQKEISELKRMGKLLDGIISKIHNDLKYPEKESKFVNSFGKWFFFRRETGGTKKDTDLYPIFSSIVADDLDSVVDNFESVKGNETEIMKELEEKLGPGLTFGGFRGAANVLNNIPQFGNVKKSQLRPYFGFVGQVDGNGIVRVPGVIGNKKFKTENIIIGDVLFAKNLGNDCPNKVVSFKPDLFSGEFLDRKLITVFSRKVDMSRFFDVSKEIMEQIEEMRKKYVRAGTPTGDHFTKQPKLFTLFVLQQHRNEENIKELLENMNEIYSAGPVRGFRARAADAYFRKCLEKAIEKYKLPEDDITLEEGNYVYVYCMFVNRQNMSRKYFYNISGRLGSGTRITEKLYSDANNELYKRMKNPEHKNNEWFNGYLKTLELYGIDPPDISLPKNTVEEVIKSESSLKNRFVRSSLKQYKQKRDFDHQGRKGSIVKTLKTFNRLGAKTFNVKRFVLNKKASMIQNPPLLENKILDWAVNYFNYRVKEECEVIMGMRKDPDFFEKQLKILIKTYSVDNIDNIDLTIPKHHISFYKNIKTEKGNVAGEVTKKEIVFSPTHNFLNCITNIAHYRPNKMLYFNKVEDALETLNKLLLDELFQSDIYFGDFQLNVINDFSVSEIYNLVKNAKLEEHEKRIEINDSILSGWKYSYNAPVKGNLFVKILEKKGKASVSSEIGKSFPATLKIPILTYKYDVFIDRQKGEFTNPPTVEKYLKSLEDFKDIVIHEIMHVSQHILQDTKFDVVSRKIKHKDSDSDTMRAFFGKERAHLERDIEFFPDIFSLSRLYESVEEVLKRDDMKKLLEKDPERWREFVKQLYKQMDELGKSTKMESKYSIKEALNTRRSKVKIAAKKYSSMIEKIVNSSLTQYKSKRDFNETLEPEGKEYKDKNKYRFVIQDHFADKAGRHFDLRLENNEGTLSSWAIPKHKLPSGKAKLLAVKTEDHPISYNKFEGEIPNGYGKGHMKIYDSGNYEEIESKKDSIIFKLNGKKETGSYTLFNTDESQWLIMQHKKEKEASRFDQIYKLAVPSDARVLENINLKKLKESNPLTPNGDELQNYYSKMNEMAKSGPEYSKKIIDMVRGLKTKLTRKCLKELISDTEYSGLKTDLLKLLTKEEVENEFIEWALSHESSYGDMSSYADLFDIYSKYRIHKNMRNLFNSSLDFKDAAYVVEALDDDEGDNFGKGHYGPVKHPGTLVKKYDDMSLVELTQLDELIEEGKMMGHCLSRYLTDLSDGIRIYSLRDSRGPHVTLEIEGDKVRQIKGKQNKPPVSKYLSTVRSVIMDMKWNPLCVDFKSINWGETEEEKKYIDPMAQEIIYDTRLIFRYGLYQLYPKKSRELAEKMLEDRDNNFFLYAVNKAFPDLTNREAYRNMVSQLISLPEGDSSVITHKYIKQLDIFFHYKLYQDFPVFENYARRCLKNVTEFSIESLSSQINDLFVKYNLSNTLIGKQILEEIINFGEVSDLKSHPQSAKIIEDIDIIDSSRAYRHFYSLEGYNKELFNKVKEQVRHNLKSLLSTASGYLGTTHKLSTLDLLYKNSLSSKYPDAEYDLIELQEGSLTEKTARFDLIHKLAVPSDARALQQMNLKELKRNTPRPDNKSELKKYYIDLNKKSLSGPRYKEYEIDLIRSFQSKLTRK